MYIDGWFLEQSDQLISASNFTVVVILTILATAILFRLRKINFTGHTDLFFIMTGVMIEAYGWALHRLYYGITNMYRLYGNSDAVSWLAEHRYFTLLPMTLVFMGLIFILGPLLSLITNSTNRWKHMAIMAGFIISLSWFAFWQLGEGLKYKKEQIEAGTLVSSPARPDPFLNIIKPPKNH